MNPRTPGELAFEEYLNAQGGPLNMNMRKPDNAPMPIKIIPTEIRNIR